MSNSNESTQKTLIVALLLCIVCSVFVSTAAVLLKPVQIKNQSLNVKSNILAAAGMLEANASSEAIEAAFQKFEVKLVQLDTGEYVDPAALGLKDAVSFDQYRAAKDPKTSRALSSEEDSASIKRLGKIAKVYLLKEGDVVKRVILPVHGYGLWSTLYGFLALEGNANSVVGLGFYSHAETPGLGGEVDNPKWQALWAGKAVYGDNTSVPALALIKGSVDASQPGAVHQVDGLAGATLTSRGVTNLLHFWMSEKGFATYLNKLRAGEV